MDAKIKRERVLAIVQSYGADPDRWPVDEKEDALHWVMDDRELAMEVARQREVDEWLETITAPTPSSGLYGRILAIAERAPGRDAIGWLLGWLFPGSVASPAWVWRTALAAALPLLVGVLGGMSTVNSAATDEWDNWEEEIYITGIVSVDSGMDLPASANERSEEAPR